MPLPVIAAIIRENNRVLLCQRKGGAWRGNGNFPEASWKREKRLKNASFEKLKKS